MNFVIKFKTCTAEGMHVIGLTNSYGMDYVRYIQEIYPELIDVPISDITLDTSCPAFQRGAYTLIVPQESLDEYPRVQRRFSAVNYIDVYVPDGFLGQFYRHRISQRTPVSYKTWYGMKRISHYTYMIDRHMNDRELLQSWISAGCPLKWNVTDEDFTDVGDYYSTYKVSYVNHKQGTLYKAHSMYDVLLHIIHDSDRNRYEDANSDGIYQALKDVKSIEFVEDIKY